MANYVFNYLYMNEGTIKKYCNGEGELDFNKIIPKPEIFSHIKFQLFSQKTWEIEAKFMNFIIHKEKNLEKENINELIMLFLNKLGEKLEGKNFEEILKNNPENETALAPLHQFTVKHFTERQMLLTGVLKIGERSGMQVTSTNAKTILNSLLHGQCRIK